jgi:hypothetical protein
MHICGNVSGREEMAGEVIVGDNITMLCQSFGNETFSIMLVDLLVHMIQEYFTNVYGQKWFDGDYVI